MVKKIRIHDVVCNICSSKRRKLVFEIERYNEIFKVQQCLDCGLVCLSPRPESSELDKYYSNTYDYEGFLKNVASIRQNYQKDLRLIQRYKGKGNLLEVGCMYGFLLDQAQKHGYSSYGVEISQKAVDYAKKNLGLNIYHGRLEDSSFQDEFFDIVFLSHLIEHLEDPTTSLRIIYRIIKNDGVLIIKCPNFGSLMSKITGKHWWWIAPPEHLYHFTPKTIRSLLKKAGFLQTKIYTRQGDLRYLRYLSALFFALLPMPKSWKINYRAIIDEQPQHCSQKILRFTYNLAGPIITLIHKINLGEEMVVVVRK